MVSAAGPSRQALQDPLAAEIGRAQREAQAASAQAGRLEQQAAAARDTARRLQLQQAAAAERIGATEARISAIQANQRRLGLAIAARRRQLEQELRPATSLLAGVATMARRPPLLTLAGGGTEEFVRVRILLDSTLPVIRQRTAGLRQQLGAAERLQQGARAAGAALARERQQLAQQRSAFAALEDQALRMAASSGGAALSAGDVALASQEAAERLTIDAADRRSSAVVAAQLAAIGPAPHLPAAGAAGSQDQLDYRLPAAARVTEGLGEISPAGIRSRGLTLATRRGARLLVPASGTVRFAGPFRDYDGVVIIDHGGGWMSLLLNAATNAKVGSRVHAGQPLGRALGPLGVELSRNGQHRSPALIAGSSPTLSKGSKGS